MGSLLGFWLGGAVAILLLAALVRVIMRMALRRKILGRPVVALSTLIAGVFAVPLGAAGGADGGPMQWGQAAVGYLPVAVVIAIGSLFWTPKPPKEWVTDKADVTGQEGSRV